MLLSEPFDRRTNYKPPYPSAKVTLGGTEQTLNLLSLLEIEYVNMVYKLASVLILMIEVSETS